MKRPVKCATQYILSFAPTSAPKTLFGSARSNAGSEKSCYEQGVRKTPWPELHQITWWLLFAIAELAGSVWPKQARQAAERLSRTSRTPSLGLQLLAAIRDMFAIGGMEITSQQVVNELNADPDGIWREYRGKSPITQRQVAELLEPYDIRPVVVHPTKRKDLSRHGYTSQQFVEAFERFLPSDPNI